MDFKYVSGDDREKLFEEVWTDPVILVAERYGLSDNGLRRNCKKLGIPLPPAGYWAKIKAGQKIKKPDLPPVTGDAKRHVRNYVIKHRIDLEVLSDDELIKIGEFGSLREETKAFIKSECSKVQVKKTLKYPHRFIIEHQEASKSKQKQNKNVASGFRSSTDKAILPIYASGTNINRSYSVLDSIINTIDDMEGHINIGWESGESKAYFILMHTVLYFKFLEDGSNLLLEINPISVFCDIKSDEMIYRDNNENSLEAQVGKIVYDMFVVADKLYIAELLDEREQKRKELERERQRKLEKMRKGELEEIRVLQEAASDWTKAQDIRKFADHFEYKINNIADVSEKEQLIKWLGWARDKADWLDPLTEKEDELLGKSRYLIDEILQSQG